MLVGQHWRVHRRMMLMSSPRQHTCFSHLTWMVCELGSKWPYSWCFFFVFEGEGVYFQEWLVYANGLGDLGSISGRVIPKTQKMPSCLTLSIIRYRSRVKWVNPEKGVAPSLIPRCSSNWKGSLLVTLDYSHQLYLLTCLLESKKCSHTIVLIWQQLGRIPVLFYQVRFQLILTFYICVNAYKVRKNLPRFHLTGS